MILGILTIILAITGAFLIMLSVGVGTTDGDIGMHIVRWVGVATLAVAFVCFVGLL